MFSELILILSPSDRRYQPAPFPERTRSGSNAIGACTILSPYSIPAGYTCPALPALLTRMLLYVGKAVRSESLLLGLSENLGVC